MDGWKIKFYATDSGRKPVIDFIEEQDEETQAHLLKEIEKLKILNIEAKPPFVKKMRDKLWELRTDYDTDAYRVFYFFFTGKEIILVHAIKKKSNKTPLKELDTAIERMNRVINQKKQYEKT